MFASRWYPSVNFYLTYHISQLTSCPSYIRISKRPFRFRRNRDLRNILHVVMLFVLQLAHMGCTGEFSVSANCKNWHRALTVISETLSIESAIKLEFFFSASRRRHGPPAVIRRTERYRFISSVALLHASNADGIYKTWTLRFYNRSRVVSLCRK